MKYFQTHSASAKSTEFCNLREICDHHCLPPGQYVIVPSTFEPDEEGDFILRVYSERKGDQARYVVHRCVIIETGISPITGMSDANHAMFVDILSVHQ